MNSLKYEFSQHNISQSPIKWHIGIANKELKKQTNKHRHVEIVIFSQRLKMHLIFVVHY